MTEIDKLYDEENCENIFLYNQNGDQIEFEQVALVPIKNKVYCILKPVIPFEGMGPDEGLVFEITVVDDEEMIILVHDEKIIDDVFDVYFQLIESE